MADSGSMCNPPDVLGRGPPVCPVVGAWNFDPTGVLWDIPDTRLGSWGTVGPVCGTNLTPPETMGPQTVPPPDPERDGPCVPFRRHACVPVARGPKDCQPQRTRKPHRRSGLAEHLGDTGRADS